MLNVTGTNSLSYCGVLTNAGRPQFGGSGLLGSRLGIVGMCNYNPPGFDNQAGAVFELQGDQSVYGMGGFGTTAWLTNAGTVRKSGGSGVAQMGESSYPLAF